MERRLALLLVWLLLGAGAARAQWVVSDPSNLAQGIVNSTNEMVHTSSTAQSMLQNFQQTVKIYEQNKKYYDALRKVNKLVRDARKVQRCMLLVGEISDIYVDGYRRIVTDTNFSVEELAAIAIGYKRIIEEAAGELKDLGEIINPTDMSLTDKDRIDVVERVYGTLMRHRRLAGYFTRRCISVSLLRAHTAIWSEWWRSTARTNNATGDGSHAAIDGQHARHPPSALYRYDDALRGHDLRSLGHRRSRSAALHLLPCVAIAGTRRSHRPLSAAAALRTGDLHHVLPHTRTGIAQRNPLARGAGHALAYGRPDLQYRTLHGAARSARTRGARAAACGLLLRGGSRNGARARRAAPSTRWTKSVPRGRSRAG